MKKTYTRITLLSIFLLILFGLSGCIKGNISVDIKANGSGIVSVSFGMTQQAKTLISNQDTNPLQDIEQSLSDGSGIPPTDVNVTKWLEGDYEWTKAEKEFSNLDEINKVILNKPMFNHFSLTRKRGVFQDEFILDAELDAFNADISLDDSEIDPATFVEIDFSVKLPGELTEANGFIDANEPNLVVWKMEGHRTVPVNAKSVTWNWLNISGILVGCLFFIFLGVYALGNFNSVLSSQSQDKKSLSKRQHTLQSKNEKTSYIVKLNIEKLLLHINTRALNSAGKIYKKTGQIALVWKDDTGKQRFIDVKELKNNQIFINGQVCLTTRESIKSELINALNKQRV